MAQSEAFEILSSALDEAIENAKADKKFLREKTVSIEIEPLKQYSASDITSHLAPAVVYWDCFSQIDYL